VQSVLLLCVDNRSDSPRTRVSTHMQPDTKPTWADDPVGGQTRGPTAASLHMQESSFETTGFTPHSCFRCVRVHVCVWERRTVVRHREWRTSKGCEGAAEEKHRESTFCYSITLLIKEQSYWRVIIDAGSLWSFKFGNFVNLTGLLAINVHLSCSVKAANESVYPSSVQLGIPAIAIALCYSMPEYAVIV